LAGVEPFEPAALEAHLKDFVERKGVKIGDLVHAVRVAVTGKVVGFGLFDALAILGRERCERRIKQALELSPMR
jgi:glutamyl-tRNA synthetase